MTYEEKVWDTFIRAYRGDLQAQAEILYVDAMLNSNNRLIKEEKKMLNAKKYENQLIGAEPEDRACAAARLRGVFCKHDGTDVYDCKDCMQESFTWLFSEHELSLLKNGDGLTPGDWIMVRDDNSDIWDKMMFVCYCDGLFFVVDDNTLRKPRFRENGVNITGWKQARLPEEGE